MCEAGKAAFDSLGTPCFDVIPAWRPLSADQLGQEGCECKPKTCEFSVYEAIFSRELTTDDAHFPKALPGLTKEDLLCIVTDSRVLRRLGAVPSLRRDKGITEDMKWTWKYSGSAGNFDVPVFKDIELAELTTIWALGDIHGRLGSLRAVHYRWLEVNRMPYVVGTGDMIDRGNRQLEVVAGMIAWRALYPHKVSVLRGNHETNDIAATHGFSCVDQKEAGKSPYISKGMLNGFYLKYLLFFAQKLPAALRIKQTPEPKANAVFMHGGFGPQVLKKLRSARSF